MHTKSRVLGRFTDKFRSNPVASSKPSSEQLHDVRTFTAKLRGLLVSEVVSS